ncbi:type II secretion system protein GspL [Parendozoicomonas haliclonae]|uniref:Type II secretion system protein L n=1 Tax=Parendozoicomonas haliclonae TaxID=1960125 RepID=A0A1X7AH09_9GAMM|nr:type II secretion system protein GspL [Parendozoicomonas haliclonae]SMA39981.1 Type II secretion system protein L [Parendozoicomonas haliclonae]
MANSLVLRLPSSADEPVYWCTAKEQGRGTLENLPELAQRFSGLNCIVLIPGESVALHQLEQTGRISSAVLKSLRWRIEDDMAEDVEQLHLAVLNHQNGIVSLACIAEHKMQLWRQWLTDAGLEAKQWLPDVLALPWVDDEEPAIQVAELDNKCLVRSGRYEAGVCEQDWVSLYLQSINPQDRPVAHNKLDSLRPLYQQACESPVNVLQGQWQPQSRSLKQIRVWRTAAVLAFVTLGTFITQGLLHNVNLEEQNRQLHEQARSIYQQLFPGERIVRLESQMQQKLDSLNSGQASEQLSMPSILDTLAPAFAKASGITVISMDYQQSRKELRITAEARNFEAFNLFRDAVPVALKVSIDSVEQQPADKASGRSGSAKGVVVIQGVNKGTVAS